MALRARTTLRSRGNSRLCTLALSCSCWRACPARQKFTPSTDCAIFLIDYSAAMLAAGDDGATNFSLCLKVGLRAVRDSSRWGGDWPKGSWARNPPTRLPVTPHVLAGVCVCVCVCWGNPVPCYPAQTAKHLLYKRLTDHNKDLLGIVFYGTVRGYGAQRKMARRRLACAQLAQNS